MRWTPSTGASTMAGSSRSAWIPAVPRGMAKAAAGASAGVGVAPAPGPESGPGGGPEAGAVVAADVTGRTRPRLRAGEEGLSLGAVAVPRRRGPREGLL